MNELFDYIVWVLGCGYVASGYVAKWRSGYVAVVPLPLNIPTPTPCTSPPRALVEKNPGVEGAPEPPPRTTLQI